MYDFENYNTNVIVTISCDMKNVYIFFFRSSIILLTLIINHELC